MSEIKILLCDDDPDLLGLLIRRLKKMGIEPDTASDGREAKSLVDANTYDVIVTDIYMPEATGLEVMQYAKQKDADTQVVIITSSATLDNAIDALNHGSFGYLTKPFDHLIVFDNMVSRALEYRQLIVADKHRAEAQKRRGDMLEDEVAERVRQLQKNQKGLLDLLGSLPDGILVIEEGGKVVLSSPVGERWLALDQKSEDQLIHRFINQVHAEMPESTADMAINGVNLHVMSADFRDDGEVMRKAVIIREVEEDTVGAGSMVTETVMGIKKGLATLYEQGMGTEVVLNVASQFAVLEQLQGWSTGTGELNPEQAASQAPLEAPPDPGPDSKQSAAPDPIPTPEPAAVPAPAPEQSAAPDPNPTPEPATAPDPIPTPEPADVPAPAKGVQAQAPPKASDADAMTTIPPFTLPRERTPTGELDGPRLNTSELQNALRASAPADEHPAAAEPPLENLAPQAPVPDVHQESPVAEIPAAEAPPPEDPMVSSPSQEAETAEAVGDSQADGAPSEEPTTTAAPQPEASIDAPVPGASAEADTPPTDFPLEDAAPTADPDPVPEAELPGETQPAAEGGVKIPTGSDPVVAEQPEADVSELEAEDQEPEFPRAKSGTGDVPSWINGVQGRTDPDLLADFEFEHKKSETSFPAAENGEVLEDDSMFKPRVIPEEMSAKLNTPTEIPNSNGDQEHVPPQHDGPITIQAAQADTQMFRKVLAGLSGTEVLSGDYEKPPGEPPEKNGDAVAKADDGLDELLAAEEGLDELRSAVREATEPDLPIEAPQVEIPTPAPEELRQMQDPEPEPQAVDAEPASWPPTLPTQDDDWDDELDVSE